MSNPHQNLIPNEPGLADVLNQFKKALMLQFNCHAIGTVQAFNPTTQTANVTINYKKSFSLPNAKGDYVEQLVNYPILADCPAVFLGGGSGCLTFPVEPGDECIVLFNDRDLDNWFTSGSTTNAPNTARLHAFGDGLIIVGPRSLPNVIPTFANDAVELRTFLGTTKISLKADGSAVSIQVGSPAVTMEINQLGEWKLVNATGQDLITTLMNLFLNSTVLGVPIVPSPTDFAILTSYKPI